MSPIHLTNLESKRTLKNVQWAKVRPTHHPLSLCKRFLTLSSLS